MSGRYVTSLLLGLLLSAPHDATEPEMSEQLRAIVEAPLVVQAEVDDDAIEVRRDIPYTADGSGGPRLDVYRPRSSAGPRPVILYAHGGPLAPGLFPEPILRPKDWRSYREHGRLAAAHGFVAVIPNHRFPSIAGIEQSFADLTAALRWLGENAEELEADPERVGLWLFSGAGAHLGWLATDAKPKFRAAIAFYPVASFEAFPALGLGETPSEVSERWEPATHLNSSMPPLLLARAGRDSPAINGSIDALIDAARAADTTLDLLFHPTGEHGFDVRNDVPRSHEIVARAFAFFADHLGTTNASRP